MEWKRPSAVVVAGPSRRSGMESGSVAGAKGGAGVTTIASNFAVSLAQESRHKVVLIDLNLQLGDAALEFEQRLLAIHERVHACASARARCAAPFAV